MSVLNSLSKKDKKWREIAYKITSNKTDADELVQQMYIKIHKRNPEKWNYSYVILTMWNLFKDSKKRVKFDSEINEEIILDVTKKENYSFTDRDLQVLRKTRILSDEEIKLISLNYDLSSCKIAKNLDQCRIKTYRDLTKIRKKVLGSNFDKEYRNRRLKYKAS